MAKAAAEAAKSSETAKASAEVASGGGSKRSKWDVDPEGKPEVKRIPGRTADGRPTYRDKWDNAADVPADADGGKRRCSRWARKWRMAMGAIMSCGTDGAVTLTEADVRKLAADLWEDVVQWATGGETERCLALFRAETYATGAPPRGLDADAAQAQWAFVPASELFLIVGEGILGIAAEGIFADNFPGHQRFSLEEFYEKMELGI